MNLSEAKAFHPVVVLGIGNPLRSDDGVGWKVIEELELDLVADPILSNLAGQVVFEAVHQLLPELACRLVDAKKVIAIDAAVDLAPGEVRVESVAPSTKQEPMFHRFELPTLLAAVKSMYGVELEAQLITIGAGDLGYGEGLSTEVLEAFPALLEAVKQEIRASAESSYS